MSSITPRTPVFAYTKISANPPITSVMEQCYWATPTDRHYSNGFGKSISFQKKFQRPKTCLPLGKVERRSDHLRGRPKSSIASTPSLTNMKVAGEKCTQIKQYSISNTNENTTEQNRCTTPDYMDEVYNEYATDLNNCLLLRRPVSEMTSRDYEQHQKNILSSRSQFNPNDDIRQFAVRSILKHMVKTPSKQLEPEMVKYIPDELVKLPEIYKEELCTTQITEPPKPKVTIDIALCDGTGLLMSGITEQENDLDEFDFNISDILESCPKNSSEIVDEQNNKVKLQLPKAKKKQARNFKKKNNTKRKLTSPFVPKLALENLNSEDYDKKADEQIKTNEWNNPEDKIVTQMSALGLAKPLNDGDLCGIRNTTSTQSYRKKQQLKEQSINIGEIFQKHNLKPVKDRRRKIPIQVICDPFKPIGIKPGNFCNDKEPYKRCMSAPTQKIPSRTNNNLNNHNLQGKRSPRLIVCKKTNNSLNFS